MASVVLRQGRERPLVQRHPWVFSGAIGATRGAPAGGDPVDVFGPSGDWLARGFYSAMSQIRVRAATWDVDQPLDEHWLRAQIERAVAGRATFGDQPDLACRLVFSEADGIPGLIVDRYGPYLVIQLLTAAMATRAALLISLLRDILAPQGIYERSDAEVRRKEGLPEQEGLSWGEAPPAQLELRPLGLPDRYGDLPPLLVDLRGGQKTGHYLDQALNRCRVAAYAHGAEVLDCFCYSGGFSLYAASAGAKALTLIDSSAAALELARTSLARWAPTTEATLVEGDVFRVLRRYREEQRRFDLIVLDPPKFAHSQKQLEHATRGYKDINLLAMQLLRPGGILASFSCSGLVSPDLFQKIVWGAALDARRDVQIIEHLGQAPDHPVLLTFPESEYLKGLICRVW